MVARRALLRGKGRRRRKSKKKKYDETRQSKQCGFCIYILDNSFDQSQSMVRLVRTEKIVLSGVVFARKIARMILIKNM